MRINISIPDNNIKERKYSILALMDLILDKSKVEYVFEIASGSDHTCISINDKEINFIDAFWNKYPKDLTYLSIENLPEPIYGSNDFAPEPDIPIIYGDNRIFVSKNKIECGIDVFASTFFMLTRWEEFVNPQRDTHNRFPGIKSIAVKYGFIERPIVNEYAIMVRNMFYALELPEETTIKRKFKLIPTHDIDRMRFYNLRNLAGDIIKRKSFRLFYRNLINSINNPFDRFQFLMDQSEKYNLKSHFYFMASHSRNIRDYEYYINSNIFKERIDEIYRRGHIIGFHPGYTTSTDSKEWIIQKNALSNKTPDPIVEGRQHFLMMTIPETLQIWNDNGMLIDSTLGYYDHIGFRCGTGDSFHIFNFISRNELVLKERPLVVMDGTLKQYMNLSIDDARKRVFNLINISKKYQTSMTILFHNSSFCNEWKDYLGLYESILDFACNQSE